MYSARIPSARQFHVSPASSVIQTPPQETPTDTRLLSRGSTQTEWMPGHSAPPPNHSVRFGWSQSVRTSVHESPRSFDTKSPPGIVPHQSTPGRSGPALSSDHTLTSFHGVALPIAGFFVSQSAGGSGYVGVAISFHVEPPSALRWSFAPKCPCSRHAYTCPSRRSGNTIDNVSPRNAVAAIPHLPFDFATVNR